MAEATVNLTYLEMLFSQAYGSPMFVAKKDSTGNTTFVSVTPGSGTGNSASPSQGGADNSTTTPQTDNSAESGFSFPELELDVLLDLQVHNTYNFYTLSAY